MGLFSQIAKGNRARKRGTECTTLDGTAFTCDLGVIDARQEAQIIDAATKRATGVGAEAKPGGTVFDFEYSVQLVAMSAIDPESPEDKPALFFDGGAEQIRDSLDRERVLVLAEQQRVHQEKTSPHMRTMNVDEMLSRVVTLAAEEEGTADPFWTLPRTTQESFVRSMARLLVSLLTDKSVSGSGEAIAVPPS